jgi:hypothetical protein
LRRGTEALVAAATEAADPFPALAFNALQGREPASASCGQNSSLRLQNFSWGKFFSFHLIYFAGSALL